MTPRLLASLPWSFSSTLLVILMAWPYWLAVGAAFLITLVVTWPTRRRRQHQQAVRLAHRIQDHRGVPLAR